MQAVKKWAQDKSMLLAILAPHAAALAREMPEALRNIKERRLYDTRFPLPDLPSWFGLYHVPLKAVMALANLLYEYSDFVQKAVTFGETINELQDYVKKSPETKPTFSSQQQEEFSSSLNNMLSSSFSELRSDLSDTPFDAKTRVRFLHSLKENETELSFLFLVIAPCWLLFKMSPNRLYRKARRGDVYALEKLLNLDPLMLHDPTIGREIQKLRFKNRTNDYVRILEAVRKPLKPKPTKSKAKASMSAFISLLAGGIEQPLTEPQIRDLHDAVTQDADSKAIDTDLPDSPEAFAKAIQREKPKWQQIINPDKKM
jgi:hypothetical protein